MELTFGERVRLLGLLPEKGNIVTLRVISETREKLSFTDEEIEQYNIRQAENRIMWALEAPAQEIEIGKVATKLIEEKLQEMDEKEELSLADVPLWDKFMEGEKDE